MKKIRLISLMLLGVFFGILGTTSFYLYSHRNTVIWTVTKPLANGKGLQILAGTKLIFDSYRPEGFDRAILSLNLESEVFRDKIEENVHPQMFLITPEWVE